MADSLVPMKSLLSIQQPKFREVSVTQHHKTWHYPSVRVAHPGDITVIGTGSLNGAAVLSKFTAAALPREPQAMTTTASTQSTTASEVTSEFTEAEAAEAFNQVDPKKERWIDQEDAKMKKDAEKAKAKAKAALKTKNKLKKTQKTGDAVEKKGQIVVVSKGDEYSDAELETNEGSESCRNTDKDEKETIEEIEEPETQPAKPSPVRWSDLDDSDSDDGRLPKQVPVAAH